MRRKRQRLFSAGRLDTGSLVTHRAPLNDSMRGYEVFSGRKDGCIKWVVTPYEPEKPMGTESF
ncbi:MAG: hypothetical protein LLF75_06415 [Eubacteriales bacterium]|nr:hypothetical protein [Eubacteriales bacterium]